MAKGIISARPSTNKPGLINIVNDDYSPTGKTVKYVERSTAEINNLVEFTISDLDGMAVNIRVIRPNA